MSWSGVSDERQRRFLLSMLFLVVLINLPILMTMVNAARLASSGTEVTAQVLEAARSEDDDAFMVVFRLDEEDVPGAAEQELVWPAPVTEEVLERAETEGTIQVRVLTDKPSVNRAEGELRSWAGLITTVAVDIVVVAIAVLWWRARRLAEDAESEIGRDGDQAPG